MVCSDGESGEAVDPGDIFQYPFSGSMVCSSVGPIGSRRSTARPFSIPLADRWCVAVLPAGARQRGQDPFQYPFSGSMVCSANWVRRLASTGQSFSIPLADRWCVARRGC